MATQTQTVINRQDPEIEAYRLGLLDDTQQLVKNQIFGQNVQNLRDQGLDDAAIAERLGREVEEVGNISQDQLFGPPEYETAGISTGEQEAIDLASKGIGGYQKYLDQSAEYLKDASSTLQAPAAQFDPSGIGAFMNPYEDAAVAQALQDVARAGERQRANLGIREAQSGGLGRARGGVEQALLSENIMDQQARTASQMRQAGYESAAQRAQQAFEQQQGRAQQGAMGLGSLAMNYSNLGQMGSALTAADIDRLMTTGGLERGIDQAGIDALRMTDLQNYSQPFQQYGFLSDIYSGVPTGSSTMQVSSMPSANPFQTAVGLGIGAYGAASGAKEAGIF